MTELLLYHGATSVCSQKVRLALAEIGLPYGSRPVDLLAGEQFAEEYIALNPKAVVPTLVDRGLVVVESSLIVEYLDREYNDSRLMPEGRREHAEARYWLLRCLEFHAAINTMTFATATRDKVKATKTPEQIAASIERMPDPVAMQKRRDLFDHGLGSVYVTQAIKVFERCFFDMALGLERAKWIAGTEFSIADIAVLPYVDRLERLGFSGLWSEFSAIEGWLDRMRARKSYATAIDAFIPEDAAIAMKKSASKHWFDLSERWNARQMKN